jgi:hypothetical protein
VLTKQRRKPPISSSTPRKPCFALLIQTCDYSPQQQQQTAAIKLRRKPPISSSTPRKPCFAPIVQTCDLFSAAATTTMDSSNSDSLEEQTKLRELTSAKGTSQLSNFHLKNKNAHIRRTLNITYLLLLQSTQETSIHKSFKMFLQHKYGR